GVGIFPVRRDFPPLEVSDIGWLTTSGTMVMRCRCQMIRAASGSKMTLTSLVWNANPNRIPERTSATGHLVCPTTSNRQSAATAGANAGISSMHEELSSMHPGDAITIAVVKPATHRPLTRRLMMKMDVSKSAANREDIRRGPRIEGDKCFRI